MAKGAVIARILSEYSDKGTKAAIKDLEKTGKSFKDFSDKAVKAFGVAAAASAAFAIKIGVDSVKAAMADQASAAALANTLHNVVGANDAVVASVENFVLQTELATGVVDDQLRPALGLLIASTRDVAQAQTLLGLALDVSAGSGADLQSVSAALAKAQNGNFGALQRLLPSMDASIVKTKNYQAALKFLADTYGGAALAKSQTFEGQLKRIKIAFDETKETIGYGLLPALQALADQITSKAIPALMDWLDKNGQKIVGAFKAGVGYVVAFAKVLFDTFSFVARNIKVFAELGAVIAAAIFGAKVAAATTAMVNAVMAIIKVMKALRTASLGAAAAEALATGGISAAAGAAAFGVALIAINKVMGKFEKDANAAGDSLGDLKFNFNGLKVSANDYLKGLTGVDSKTTATTKSTQALTKAQTDALNALKKLGIVPTKETDPIQLEAVRLNLIKQGNLEEARRVQALMDQLEAQMKNNDAAQRYADILQVLADNQISSQEVAVLAQKWNVTSGQVMEYIARIYAANSTPANSEAVIQLYMAWGLTREEAKRYVDFAAALKDQKLDESEITKLMSTWNMTRAEVIAYAKKVQDGTVFSSTWADPGNAAKKAWEDALNALNNYLAKVAAASGTKQTGAVTLPTGVVIEPSKGGAAATTALTNIGLATTTAAVNAAVNAASTTAATANEIANVMMQTLVASPTMTASLGGLTGVLSTSRYTGQALAWAAANGMLGTTTTPGGGNTTIVVQGNVVTQADNVAAIRQDLLNSQLSGRQITALAVAL